MGGFPRERCSRARADETRLAGGGRMDLGRCRWRREEPWRPLQQSWPEALESRDGGGQVGRTPGSEMWSRLRGEGPAQPGEQERASPRDNRIAAELALGGVETSCRCKRSGSVRLRRPEAKSTAGSVVGEQVLGCGGSWNPIVNLMRERVGSGAAGGQRSWMMGEGERERRWARAWRRTGTGGTWGRR